MPRLQKSGNLWWAYVHINMSLHVKRYFSDDNIKDTQESGFVLKVFEPFYAQNREDAINKIDSEYMAFMKSYQEM